LKVMSIFKICIITIILSWTTVFAQAEGHVPSEDRGDPLFRRSSNLDGNNVRVTVHNIGQSGWVGNDPGQWAFEWPKNTNREHIVFVSIWLGGEVIDTEGNVRHLIDLPNAHQGPSGESWNMEPVPGFLNPNAKSLARSDDSETWPSAAQGGWRDKLDDPVDPGWVGSWNGFFGKNIFNADLEMFYRCSDDNYKTNKFTYYPDDTDLTRGGMGLVMDVRAFAWTQILINDVVFFIHDIKNDGTKRLEKATFMIWLADLVGGDSDDDEPFVDLQTDIAFLTDRDRIGTDPWGDDPVGLGGIKFLETPGNQVDGIDNDGDSDNYPHLLSAVGGDSLDRVPLFTEDDFGNVALNPGDKIVLIDSLTFERRVIEYPVGGGTVTSLGRVFELPPEGKIFVEDTIPDLKDDDLDGLIDEQLSLHLERFDEISGTVKPVRYINYLSFEPGDTIKRGFITAGKNAVMNYENVAPMIDESRDDNFDNDNDWVAAQDDLGQDGAETTGDTGEGDGLPTSGTGTDFPGEPNIDKTDVSETDLMGITSALVDPAFGVSFSPFDDEKNWRKFMTPGRFYLPDIIGEYDTYVSSGYFPIEPGERQRMAVSVAMAGGGITKDADIESAIQKSEQARIAYELDYRFAQAPVQVTLTAVPGDRKVTLYWDDAAEFSEDDFIKRQGGPFKDFEGYRIYRTTDAAFEDAKVITDGSGNPLLLKPIAQFDLDDGIRGYHPIDIYGVKYQLGDDSGLQHSYIDSGLTNGQRYFYAVTAYDFGYEFGNIAPTETPIQIDRDRQGNFNIGSNIAIVRPRASAAGYLPSEVESFTHTTGSSTGDIEFEIVDPRAVKDGHEYQITFEDTLIQGVVLDKLTTKNFTIKDVTADSVIMDKSTMFNDDDEVPLIDGFRITFYNEDQVKIDPEKAKWSSDDIFDYQFSPTQFLNLKGVQNPFDYQIIFGDVGLGASKDTTIGEWPVIAPLPAKEVNFKIINISQDKEIEFAFGELDGTDGRFTIDTTNANNADIVFFLEEDDTGKLIYTWQLILNTQPPDARNPMAGDTLQLYLRKPFLSRDTYNFVMKKENESKKEAKSQLDEIRVVPNPYVAAETWEPFNTFSSGRGPREIHFINLPRKCTIRIFNVNGDLIDKIEHDGAAANTAEYSNFPSENDGGFNNGTAIWDMLSSDNLEISYGIYLFHVQAPGIGEKTGTFAIIK